MRKEIIKARVTKYIEDGINPTEVRNIVSEEIRNMILIDSITDDIYMELVVNNEVNPYNSNNNNQQLALKD